MHPLHRKLIRDLLHMKGQALAIALVIASGVSVFVMSLSTLEALKLTRATYYDRYRFADVFAQLKRAPLSLADRIAQIPGVAQVDPRVVMDVTLDVEGMSEPAVGRLISVPGDRRPRLNDLHLRSGRWVEPGRRGEVLASESFAGAHGFEPGDSFNAILNGRLQRLTIVGIALSPEYVYQIRGNDIVPDNRRFGVFWMEEEQLASVFDMQGAFNDITISLLRGASVQEVLARVDQLIEPYGGAGAYGRDEQISARFLDNEITQLMGTAFIAPLIFLGVAAFLLNVVVTRLISTQREQIAALKAFGYTHWEVGLHYLQFVVLITLTGTAIGTVLGLQLGKGITSMYAEFYHFPVILYRFDPTVVSWAIVISLVTAVVGTLGSVRTAIRLPPAEAMRPAPPAQFRETLFERMGWSRFLSSSGRMIVRELERRPFKALLSILGISFAVAVLVLGNFGMDAVDYMMNFQYFITQRQDVSVAFVEPLSATAEYELQHLPGVLRVETYRAVPVRLRHAQRSRRTVIMGLPQERELYRLIDADENLAKLPPAGIMLSDKLAELLGVGLGETVIVEVLEGQRPVWEIPVTATIVEFAGTNAYMDREALSALLREEGSISGAHLRVDGTRQAELYHQLKHTPPRRGCHHQVCCVSELSGHRRRKPVAVSVLQCHVRLHHRLRCGLQHGSHFAVGAEPRDGDVAGHWLHAGRDLRDSAGRAGDSYPGSDSSRLRHRLRFRVAGDAECPRRTVPVSAGHQSADLGVCRRSDAGGRSDLGPHREAATRHPGSRIRAQTTRVKTSVPAKKKSRWGSILRRAAMWAVGLAVLGSLVFAFLPKPVGVDLAIVEHGR